MITFEQIISEKNKNSRDKLINEKLLELNDATEEMRLTARNIGFGFISNKSSVQFSEFHYDMNLGLGSIYGMRATDYFYEFFDFLAHHQLHSKQDVILFVSSFLKDYFAEREGKTADRELLFDDICRQLDNMSDDKERFFRNRNAWLDIGIFKNRSAAECTEFSAIAQNLLSFCDIDVCYVSGHMKTSLTDEDHAFNIFKYNDEFYLLDSTNPICLFDEKGNLTGFKSYICKVPYDKVVDFIKNKGVLSLNKSNYMRNAQGKVVLVNKSLNEYSTTSSPINEEELNEFFGIGKRL